MDKYFNHDVAEWISKSMSRMDDDEAEMFARFFVYEVHKQDIENNRRTLDRHVEDISKSIWADMPKQYREVISKETPFEEEYGKPQPRNQSGRWVKIGFTGPNLTYERKRGDRKGEKIDITSALNRTGQETSAFADRWNASGPNDASTNERTYRRIAEGSKLLGTLGGPKAQMAATVGQFAGQFGPEAERVIGPAARKTAYRYRGTERMPDNELMSTRNEAMITARKRMYSDDDFKAGRAKPLNAEQRMAASEAAAANYLFTRLPKKSLATLQRESGKLPPSEGVIINRDGEIVTQAVGYNEDHYLPFNLKNLKGLQGGAYVRTRSTGGLTSEDIYTGLLAGARSITVVSRSGVFTLDFEDDLRGGRRYSDKARQMVGRYAQTLDAVQSEKVSRRGLDPDERADIREEVEAEMEGVGYKSEEIEAEIKRREREYSASPRLSKAELEKIKVQAMEAVESGKGPRGEGSERFVPKDPKKAYNYYRSEFMDAAMEEKQNRMYRLDAEGYEAAMDALREQFPYYVNRVKVHKIPRGGEKDFGYVRPNYNRPKAVQAGYFDEDINGRGKFSASELHYQNAGRHLRRDAPAGAEGQAEGAAATGAPRKKVNVAEVRAQAAVQERRNAAVKSAADAIGIFEIDEKKQPMLARYRASGEGDLNLMKPGEIDALIGELHAIKPIVTSSKNRTEYSAEVTAFEDSMKTLERTDAQMKSRVAFKEADWDPNVVSHVPQRAGDEDHFSPGHEPMVYQRAWAKTINDHRLGRDVTSSTITDTQLRAMQKKYSDIYSAAGNLVLNPTDGNGMNKLAEAMSRAGMSDSQIEGLEERFDKNGASGLESVVEENKRKALGIIKLRSILVASDGKLNAQAAPAPTPAAQTTVTSQVIARKEPEKAEQEAPEPKKKVGNEDVEGTIKYLEAMSTDHKYSQQDRAHLGDLVIALQDRDKADVIDVLQTLPKNILSRVGEGVTQILATFDDD